MISKGNIKNPVDLIIEIDISLKIGLVVGDDRTVGSNGIVLIVGQQIGESNVHFQPGKDPLSVIQAGAERGCITDILLPRRLGPHMCYPTDIGSLSESPTEITVHIGANIGAASADAVLIGSILRTPAKIPEKLGVENVIKPDIQ